MSLPGKNRIVAELRPAAERALLMLSEYCELNGLNLSYVKRKKDPIQGEECSLVAVRPSGEQVELGSIELYPKKTAN